MQNFTSGTAVMKCQITVANGSKTVFLYLAVNMSPARGLTCSEKQSFMQLDFGSIDFNSVFFEVEA